MPKEIIDSDIEGKLIVAWDRDLHAQLRVDLGRPFVFVDKNGQPIKDESTGVPTEYYSLSFTFINRSDYNRAIRAIRRARDQVLGKDE